MKKKHDFVIPVLPSSFQIFFFLKWLLKCLVGISKCSTKECCLMDWKTKKEEQYIVWSGLSLHSLGSLSSKQVTLWETRQGILFIFFCYLFLMSQGEIFLAIFGTWLNLCEENENGFPFFFLFLPPRRFWNAFGFFLSKSSGSNGSPCLSVLTRQPARQAG